MKSILAFTFIILFSLILVSPISAQDTGTAPPPGGVTEQETKDPVVEEEKVVEESKPANEQFVNGIIAGALGGLVVGAVFGWLFKDKLIK